MARLGRLAGALLAETDGRWFLIGNPKEPCDFAAAGFRPPDHIDAVQRPYVALEGEGPSLLAAPWIHVPLEGEALARLVADRLLIRRNGSVSERLWSLVIGADPDTGEVAQIEREARWLAEVPEPIWDIVRDSVLRCL